MPTISDDYAWKGESKRLSTTGYRYGNPDVIVVRGGSPRPHRAALEKIARFLQREQGYDFPPYGTDRHPPAGRGYLFASDDHDVPRHSVVLGGLLVCSMEWQQLGPCPTLAWAWLHPYCRRQGWLTALWPTLQELHGDFGVQPPLSRAMAAFLERTGWTFDAWKERRLETLSPHALTLKGAER